MSWISVATLLFLVMDPFGNVPFFACVLRAVPPERRQWVVLRELIIALAVMVVFLFAGPQVLKFLHISEASLRIAGGLILLLIAIKMIFGRPEDIVPEPARGNPLIVPLAIPSIAGPSTLATLLVLVGQESHRWLAWLLALTAAWLLTAVILLLCTRLSRLLGDNVLSALQTLMGLILTTIAIEMGLQGVRVFLNQVA